ncbi:diguanylate cyclase [Rhizobium sp. Leaf371]|uniref:GGDEF domain-containing protein n=1 Tax=Rhizobium sp. Leaf371 TaxID=1736355 RepID=UPI0007158317|nr:GGDEF domain-containing protein [Rhizobium sp. Leaf371]KQS65576.1 diguanylate cyclase [Rhizobium sp. Leaf371]
MLHLAHLMDGTDVMVAVYDQDDRLRFANAAFRAAWHIAEEEHPLWPDLMRRNFAARRGTVIAAEDFEAWLRSVTGRRGKTGFRAFETDLHDGRWLWMTETMHADGWMLCVASDITSLRPDERELRQARDMAIKASETDDLTGIASRRFVMSKLDALVKTTSAAPPAPTGQIASVGCIAVLDIDNFKYINDRFGHSIGDAVLKNFAATIQRLVRKTDVLGRVGGEEFVLVLPNTTTWEAEAILSRMLTEVRQSRPVREQASFRYTFSAGLAGARAGDDPADLYRRADLALYAAKMRGRDQIGIDAEGPRATG